MPEAVNCRGCGRRVVLPESINRSKARCPKCRTKVEEQPAAPVHKDLDAYEIFLSQSLELHPVKAPEAPLELPEREVLSLDDAPSRAPRPQPKPVAPVAFFPPPFRFHVYIVADSHRKFHGNFRGVLTPHGLFLESLPDKPLIFAPLGTRCTVNGSIIGLALPNRVLQLRLGGIPEPAQLAADTSAFLAGQRPVPLPAEYRRPWWLAGIGALLALGLASGPIVLTQVADLELWIGLILAGAFAFIATTANAGIALFTKLPTGVKVALMAAASAAMLGVFLVVAMTFLVNSGPTIPKPPPTETPPGEPPPTPPPSDPPSVPPTHQGPLSHIDLAYRDGRTRLEDGLDNVTALAVSPLNGAVIVGHADGSTRIWPLDQPSFEPPHLGPRGSGAIHRIDFDPTGKLVMLSCDRGLVITPLLPVSKNPLLIPGDQVVASLEPNREKFAAVRANRVQVRNVPLSLVKDPPAARAGKGFVVTTPKDEVQPTGFPMTGLAPPTGKATFLAFHPTGRLLAGGMDGSIVTLGTGGPPLPAFTSREHKAAVRTWAVSPFGDFAFGDDDGFVGYWPSKSPVIAKFKTGGVGIKGLAFNPCGGELAVVDTAGWVSVWDPVTGVKSFEVKQNRLVAAVCYGPHEDLLMLSDGKGVEVWWLPELEAQSVKK